MNGVLVSRADLYAAPAIVPSTNGTIFRSEVAGNKATYVLPLYQGIEVGDKYKLHVDTNGQWNWSTFGVIDSATEVVTRTLSDVLFSQITQATAYYSIEKSNGQMLSARVVYNIQD